ncbi:phosphoribosyl-ATP pyrophosphatase /phosphoribosyl-AMP cyclohydrolase [Lachnospiraceae bacterium XBB1006]|nr:phosphoribosyl-ATP pyrophosphatase /phosphoribosyl-AMP cyclohydrolase [Lachnospiraceae bacterium XBB1006]
MTNSYTERKRLMATMYLKDGEAVRSREDHTIIGQAIELARIYNDSGIDRIMLWDISPTKEGHDTTLKVIREINRVLEVSSYAFGWTSSIRDIREYLFSGCRRVILSSSDPELPSILEECQRRFRSERLALALEDVDIIFKKRAEIEELYHDIYVFKQEILESLVNMTNIPFYAMIESLELEEYARILRIPSCVGVGGPLLNERATDIMTLKHQLFEQGLLVLLNDSTMSWSQFKCDSEGLISVIAQDYVTKEVLTFGVMNEEAFLLTMEKGKMHYYNRQTKEVYMHGASNENFQYVKSIFLDCHKQALLAKVSQIGVACHTGNYSCFSTEIVKKDYAEKNTVRLLENIYNVITNRKKHPREGSYTNFLLEHGINEMVRKVQSETMEIVLSAKDKDTESLRTELSDLLYYLMVLMSNYDITWDDITNELSQRK